MNAHGGAPAAAPDAQASPPSATPGMFSGADRLELTRNRLRRALREPGPGPDSHTAAPGERPVAASHPWLDSLRSLPGAGVLLDALEGWWMGHPLRAVSLLAGDAAKAIVQPMAQRHPLGLVLTAAVVGGVVAWTRPWRWALKPALLAGLLPQLVSRVVAQVPMQSWLSMLATLTQTAPRPAQAAGPEQPVSVGARNQPSGCGPG